MAVEAAGPRHKEPAGCRGGRCAQVGSNHGGLVRSWEVAVGKRFRPGRRSFSGHGDSKARLLSSPAPENSAAVAFSLSLNWTWMGKMEWRSRSRCCRRSSSSGRHLTMCESPRDERKNLSTAPAKPTTNDAMKKPNRSVSKRFRQTPDDATLWNLLGSGAFRTTQVRARLPCLVEGAETTPVVDRAVDEYGQLSG